MEPPSDARVPKMVPFRCPRCAAEQQVDLIAFSRAQSTLCTACGRRLSREQVSLAIERARLPPGTRPPPQQRGRLWA